MSPRVGHPRLMVGRARMRAVLVAFALHPRHVAVGAVAAGLASAAAAPVVALGIAGVATGLGAWAVARTAGWRATALVVDPSLARARRQAVGVASVAAVLVLGAAVAGQRRAEALSRTHLAGDFGHAVRDRATILEAPRPSPYGGWSAKARLRGEPVLLRAQTGGDAMPQVGDLVAVTGGLDAPDAFAAGRGDHAVVKAATAVVVGRRGGPAGFVDAIRRRSEQALDAGLPAAEAGLLRGMVLGEDAALPDDLRGDFRTAGLSHLVAASGTNVVLLAAMGTTVAAAVGLGLTVRLWLVLALVTLYVPLAGGGASILRAGIMGAAALTAGLAGRPVARWYAFGLAAVVTLAMDPRATSDPGWQLSFAAAGAILVLVPRWREALTRRGLARGVADVLATTVAATLVTAPIVAADFGRGSLVALPANVLAAPVVGPVMWSGVTAAVLGQLGGLGGGVAWAAHAVSGVLVRLAGLPLGFLVWLGRSAAGWPGATVHATPLVVTAIVAGAVAAGCSRGARRIAPGVVVTAVGLGVALAPARAAVPLPPARLRVTFLDVGQGDATLVQVPGAAVLVDAGPPDDGIVADLRRAGVRRLAVLVVTHAQADHEGGAAAVLAAMPVGLVLDGRDGVPSPDGDRFAAVARQRGVRLVPPAAGAVLRVGSLALHVLSPRPEAASEHAGEDPNQRAIVLEADAAGRRVLLTSDAESDVLAGLALGAVDVLKVSHHGSADAGLPALLARLRPQIAGIELGARNTYGFPAPATLRALRTVVPTIVRTDEEGSVSVDLAPDGRWAIRTRR